MSHLSSASTLGFGSSSASSSSSSSAIPGPSRQRLTGSWQPLPYIHSGFCIYPYQPDGSPPHTPATTQTDDQKSTRNRNRFSWSGLRHIGDVEGEGRLNAYEVSLDIGDEFFAFEEYKCSAEEDGKEDLWYRGYVVQAVSLPSLAPSSSTTHSATFPRPEPSVLIGIFPAAAVHVRPGASNDNGELTEAYERAIRAAEEKARNANPSWVGEMDTVKEEEEGEGTDASSPPREREEGTEEGVVDVEAHNGKSPNKLERRSTLGKRDGLRTNRPKSLVLESKLAQLEEENKEQPPLPKLTAGDSTIAGQQWPLVDEIACAIREWYGRLPTYLANREYRLFGTVMQHIDALFLGRRQLLSQTLSEDELVRIRRECVSRLVKCNVAQGLEVIVRSLEDGSVMVVDKERAHAGANWVGGIACYVYQVQLAYIDLIPLDNLFGKFPSLIDPRPTLPSAQPFSLIDATATGLTQPSSSGSYYHCFLDVRAFIANPCAPGETAELYFSLYNKAESRFVTEEFCLVLNHLGSPARDAEQRLGRLRTLFVDLKLDDLAHDIFLVCRVVRNGAMKMRQESGSMAVRPAAGRRTSLYGISEGSAAHGNPSMLDTLTDDSFSVTSGYGGQRTPTIDTSYTANGHSSSMEGKPTFRRPMGCAVLHLPPSTRLLADATDKMGTGVEFHVPIYLPKDEATFAILHENIIQNRVKEYVTSSRAEAIALSLKVFQGPAAQVIREHPSLLLDIPLSARLGFPDVVYPGTVRNDLYVKLWSAIFTPAPTNPGGSIRVRKSVIPTHQGDVQVTIEVRRGDGSIVPDVMVAGGCGEPTIAQYHSLVFHRNDRPTYGELVKISLPPSAQAEGYHLFLTFRSRGKDRHLNSDPSELEQPFAFGYLPLANGTACIQDGDHDLMLYKNERNIPPSPSTYFEVPALSQAEFSGSTTPIKSLIPLRDRVTLRTYLCSSLQTQDNTLRALFVWHTSGGGDIDVLCSTLQLFSFVSEDEIAKFAPSVFDALFSMLIADHGARQDEVELLIFKSLIKVLAMNSDRRFPNFKNVFTLYIDTQFHYPSSAFNLLRCMKQVMSTPTTTEYRAFLKVWHLFFRFIIRSQEHDRARGIGLDATSTHIESEFRTQTKSILEEINSLMRSSEKQLIGTQTLAVQHYADILPGLSRIFQPLEIAEMVIEFADTLTFATGSIAIYMLLLLLQVVKNVFESSESRSILVPAIVRWVKPHLGSFDELRTIGKDDSQITKDGKRVRWLECNRLAVTVIAWTVNKLQEWLDSPLIRDDTALRIQEEDNIEYCLTLLPTLYESYFELSSPKTHSTLNRQRSSPTSTIWKPTPDVFPSTHPFALISEMPPLSLLERQQNAGQDALPSSETFNCGLAENAMVILTLILSSPRPNITRWLNEVLDIEGVSSLSETLRSTFKFFSSVIGFSAFPKQWLTLSLMSFSSILKFLTTLSPLLESEHFIPPIENADTFDITLWTKLFELLCEFCGSEELALEDMTQQRRRAEWIIAGDLRDEGAELLGRLWNAIGWPVDGPNGKVDGIELRYGGYQTRFTGLAERILGLCLSSNDAMCETAVEILFSMIYAEYVIEGKFDTIETEIFAKLDKLFTSRSTPSSSDPTMRAYFVAQLRAVFESTPSIDQGFTEKVSVFLDEIELFIDLLLSLREIPDSLEWSDEKMSAIYRLMSFVERIGRNDLYIRFVQQLADISVQNRNWSSAGLSIRLHAQVYSWDNKGDLLDEAILGGAMKLPPQNQFQRKEALYYHAIEYFAEAEAYEHALELCQELTAQHQKLTFDVGKLTELLHHQAALWEKIGAGGRGKPEYFRVAYFGEFGQMNQDKDFVVKGEPWQRYSEFCDALQLKHPQATLHRSKIPPLPSARQSPNPLIWVTPLAPEADLTRAVFGDGVAENVQSHWRYNAVREFSSLRPYMRDQNEVEVVLTWTEKTVVTTKEELPGILNRSEIFQIRYEQIPPVSMAIMEVEKATKNLTRLRKERNGHLPESKLLGTAINGAVDSPVFLDGSYNQRHPEFTSEIEQLRLGILEYVRSIQDSLKVHKIVCKDVAFHEALKTQFFKTFSEEITLLPRNSEASSTEDIPSFDHSKNFEFTSPPNHPLPPLPNNQSYNSPVISNYSSTSISRHEGSYKLPKLKLGPTGTHAGGNVLSIHSNSNATSSPRESINTIPSNTHGQGHTRNPSQTPTLTPVIPQGRGSIRKTPSEKRLSWNSSSNLSLSGMGMGLGQRAMSIVGLSQSQRGTPPSEVGTVEESAREYNMDQGGSYAREQGQIRGYENENGNDDGSGDAQKEESGNSRKERGMSMTGGLKRFGSLIRRDK
uniref:Cytoplasmic protein n=1 Tax=Kwoniella bestiolae CBS 10118 TaxID=1296100 RepID=A0A1B9FWL8_9TREE|nr:hypothetical protein I302_07525 [Kwoniella bestiolae CBS 10118]OCF23172.1 hypothetical protein I302_07525 [Kwoniella bestiolae CBS 10118]